MKSSNRVFKPTYVAAAIVALLAIACVPAASAGTATANLSVTATIVNNCSISTTAVAFGNYDPAVANASTALTANGAISTTCTKGDAETITLGQGSNAGTGSTAAAPVRRMINGTTNYLNYALYSNSGLTTVFDGSTGVAVTGTGTAVSTTVYGSVAAGQNTLPAGSYSDTVVATVTF
jgi:spore coat protein U-like protein